jgi:2-hydroxy-3-keto-5-methylthiopentenyl-1-phosphate phosphatase
VTALSRPLDLSRCSVFVDFDGTISEKDIGITLLETFATGRWEEVDGRYERGEIGSREYVVALWRLLEGVPYEDLLAAAGQVELDPGFGPLVAYLRASGADVAVISDGIGFYVEARVRAFGVTVLANAVEVAPDGRREPRFPFAAPVMDCPCGLCGTCKVLPVAKASRRGRTTVLVGDGTSDRFAAAAANLVLAKGRLVDWCEEMGTPYMSFTTLSEVQEIFKALADG